MRIVVVRHAEAEPGEPDELRPLTEHGRAQARRLGDELRSAGVRPDAVLTSPLLRARETARLLDHGEPEPHESLAPGAFADGIRAVIAGRGETVVVVGHQPDCGRIVAELTGGDERPFPPAGIAVVDLNE